MDKNSILNFLRKDSKKLKADLVAVLATGVVLIVMGNTFFNSSKASSLPQASDVSIESTDSNLSDDMEKKLEEVFSAIEGAGKVKVMVTLKAGSEIVVAQENKTSQSNDSQSSENNVVIISQGNGVEKPLILKENYPEIEGIIIVAEGGDDIFVKDALSKGAQALLNVPAHKVEIFKMR